MKRRLLSAAVGALLLTAAAIAAAPAAQATARNGVCESGEFCLYYNSDNQGSLVDFTGSVATYGTGTDCVKFISSGNGRGQCVKNNAASAWNRSSVPVTVFYKSDWSGAIDSFVAGAKGNLSSSLKNENAGHVFGVSGNVNFEYGVYHSSSAHIAAYFDGYLSTSGRHEGVDVALGSGANVYAMIDGTVIYKNEGGGGLSTISIYNSSLDKSIIYLHTNPLDSLAVGQHVDRGQHIADEAARGATASHTHVEMRPGYHQLAAKSVDDPVLDNPIPTTFWMNHGYNICCQ